MIPEALEGLKKLKPPSGDSDGREVTVWRWTIAITVGATAVSLATHILLACGFLTAIHPGFARAGDVTGYAKTGEVKEVQDSVVALAAELKAQRLGIIESSILDTQLKKCTAPSGEVRRLYTTSLQKLLIEYANLTKHEYPLPDCESF